MKMRLVDADAEVKKREKLCEEKNCEFLKYRYQAMCKGCPIYEEIEAFDSAEEVEAEPVRNGRWENIPGMNNTVFCSECLAAANKELAMKYKACPFCLARMDGGADNA